MTKVINGGYKTANGIDKIYIGRGSPYGNPFKIGEDGTRQEAIAKYRDYMYSDRTYLAQLKALKDKTLCCFCKPLACHGDVIKEYLDSL